jgi:hypothetical protein
MSGCLVRLVFEHEKAILAVRPLIRTGGQVIQNRTDRGSEAEEPVFVNTVTNFHKFVQT